ncbi:MAG: hypothetical protein K8J08_09070, partial [Thermoanaerobaculia bacterium]|nr:hypothetical protein [Thermoanaerobaculia bacterium]
MQQTVHRSTHWVPEGSIRRRRPRLSIVLLTLFLVASASDAFAGGQGDDPSSSQDANETRRYEWVRKGKRVGELTWTQGATGRSTVVSSVTRGDGIHELREEFQSASDGGWSFFQVSGSVGGEQVSEVLEPNSDQAAVVQRVSANESAAELPAIYVPETGTPISWSVLVSRTAQSPSGRRALLPVGELSVTER